MTVLVPAKQPVLEHVTKAVVMVTVIVYVKATDPALMAF
jgi:hypothetical protein